ncbi:MAG: GNAT family N-acetyltransferase [Actinobacteria bacterium]|nr:GNAT family N-acetyltransferase [Actinomycetota bacterium]MBO0784474.1 GNAT family N-acetyltransferase [Actinomycetota bacterium]
MPGPVSTERVTIRPYRPADLDALYQICLQTGRDGDDATPLYRDPRLPGHVHAAPYALFEPSLAFVAEDGAGVGGYVIGALDSHDFEARLERDWWPELRARYPEPPASIPAHQRTPDQAMAHLIHHPWVTPGELARRYPSQLHINLVPRLQSGGHGRRLIAALTGALRQRGSRGVHLGVRPANVRAIGFYRHLGFTELPAAGAVVFAMDLTG